MQVFKNSRTALATAMTSAALLGAASVAGLTLVLDDGAPAAAPQQVTVTNSAPAASSSTSTVGQIYKRSADAVVKITVTSAGQASPMGGSGGTQQAQGSGFVYDTQGHVITNQHVVDGAQSVSVKFANGKTLPRHGCRRRPVHRPRRDRRRRARVCAQTPQARRLLCGGGRRRCHRDRQPLRARPDGHDRHRQRAAPPDQRRRTTSRSTMRSRPTQRSTTATPAGRCSTWTVT